MKKNERVFCAVRPPGHHAETVRANGFVLLIIMSDKVLQKQYKINKVAIIDFDVHHSNGTQEIFIDPTVAYGSSHEFPLFQELEQKMRRSWKYFNAVKAGTTSKIFWNILSKLKPIDKFKPEVILISTGFDLTKDPLANINLESKDFLKLQKSW